MEKFVELIQRVHQERFSVVMNKIIAEKIPIAFLSLSSIDEAVREIAKTTARYNITIDRLITPHTPPREDLHLKIGGTTEIKLKVTHFNQISCIHPRPEYIFTIDPTDARVAIQRASNCITLYPTSRNTEQIYNIFMEHLTDLREVYESLIDEESKKTFCGYWLSSITERLGEIVYTNTQHYITEGFIPEKGSIVIDGGAFDGGTAKIFSEMGYQVYAFEMDRKNFDNAKKNC